MFFLCNTHPIKLQIISFFGGVLKSKIKAEIKQRDERGEDECVAGFSPCLFFPLTLTIFVWKEKKKMVTMWFFCHMWKYKAKLPYIFPVNAASKEGLMQRHQWLNGEHHRAPNWNESCRVHCFVLAVTTQAFAITWEQHRTPALAGIIGKKGHQWGSIHNPVKGFHT